MVWHRGDLRLHDHPALDAARSRTTAIGLVILDDGILSRTTPRRVAWFLENVRALRASYVHRGGMLFVRSGEPAHVVPQFVNDLGRHSFAVAVHALRSFTPRGMARDSAVALALAEAGRRIEWHDGLYVRSPGALVTQSGSAYAVYAPWLNAWKRDPAPDPLPAPATIPSSIPLEPGDIPFVPSDVELPQPGEEAAITALHQFIDGRLTGYATRRDLLDGSGSSRLSPWITVGALSARTAAAAVWGRSGPDAAKWLAELAWRDFLADMLYHRPQLLTEPFQERWSRFPWNDNESDFIAWRDGNTGIPAVDAALRQLRQTGWISNRARMVAAQFLTRHLRIHWLKGARVFHDWLLDGDTASNIGNWQWCAGLGIDNAPYFRVFNPITQAKQHDPDGEWLQQWVPESFGSPAPLQHAIVDVATARRDYLADARATS